MAHDVFISYSHRDKAVADAMCFALEESGIRCWYAPRDVAPGKTWADAIVEAIAASRVLVLIFTDFSNKSDQVVREIDQAVQNGVPIIPFKLTETAPQGGLSYYLSTVHWLDSMSAPLETSLAELVQRAAALLETGVDDQTEQRLRAKYKGKLVYRKNQAPLGFRSGKWYFKALTVLYFAALVIATISFVLTFADDPQNNLYSLIGGVLLLMCAIAPYIILSLTFRKGDLWKKLVLIIAAEVLFIGLLSGVANLAGYGYADVNSTVDMMMNGGEYTYGNSAANLLAGGYAVKSGNYIYYRDDKNFGSVSRIDIASLETDAPKNMTIATTQRVRSLNASGDILCFSADVSGSGTNNNICTMSVASFAEAVLQDESASSVMMVNDLAVYIDSDDNNIFYIPLTSDHMSLDTNNKTLIKETGGPSDELCVNNQWIYYLRTDTHVLYKVSFNGVDTREVGENVQSYQMDADILYQLQTDSHEIVMTDLNGKVLKTIADHVTGDFIPADGKLFYKNADDNNYLYSVERDSGAQTLLYKATYDHIAVIDGYLYCFSDSGALFRIKTDGTGYLSLVE